MRIYDISLPISESLAVWPGDPSISIRRVQDQREGDPATVSELSMGAHTGTHVDAPCHFISGGAGVDATSLDILVGPAIVVHAAHAKCLSANVLDALAIPADATRVLFRTRNSERWERGERAFFADYVSISEDGADWLAQRGMRLVGIDYLSVAPSSNVTSTHQILLRSGIVPVEGLNLAGIAPGLYELVCLPLRIVGADGAPARAILIDRQHE